jgi:hypothetical protein
LKKSLDVLEKNLKLGGKRSSTSRSLEKIGEIKNDIQNNGKIDLKTLSAYRPSINEAIEEIGGFASEVPRKYKPQTTRNLNQVKEEVIKSLNQYGEKFNPEFLKYNQAANEAYAAVANSNKIAKFLQNKVPFLPKNKATEVLLGYGPMAAAGAILKSGPALIGPAAAAVPIYQGIKILHRVVNSPVLRKYYGNVLKYAANGNVPQTVKNLKALDANLQETE